MATGSSGGKRHRRQGARHALAVLAWQSSRCANEYISAVEQHLGPLQQLIDRGSNCPSGASVPGVVAVAGGATATGAIVRTPRTPGALSPSLHSCPPRVPGSPEGLSVRRHAGRATISCWGARVKPNAGLIPERDCRICAQAYSVAKRAGAMPCRRRPAGGGRVEGARCRSPGGDQRWGSAGIPADRCTITLMITLGRWYKQSYRKGVLGRHHASGRQ